MKTLAPGVTATGPLFEGQSLRIVADMLREVDQAVGEEGVALVQRNLDENTKHPSSPPFYRNHIHSYRSGSNKTLIDDGGIVYGPWLEGVGSRNETTKFKGYRSFQRATQKLEQVKIDIAEVVVHKYMLRLNG